jgi:anti-sigma regulatory factor (Ser/Thr protein kinase)
MEVKPRAPDMRETTSVCVEDASQVPAARRVAADLSRRLGFDATVTGRVSLAATEAATNLIKHAGRGEILISGIEVDGRRFVDLVALDRGPGMLNVERCFEDGYSTAGSPGTGLGAMRRLASAVDVYSRPGGTALLARVGPAPAAAEPRGGILVAGLSIPMSGEECCGDAWDQEAHAGVVTVLVVDGLGHGADAAIAAQEGVRAFRRHPRTAPGARVEALHAALRATRGAAVAVAAIDPGRRTVRFAGLGNISAAVHGDGPVRHLVSNHGTAGHVARKIDEYTYPWPAHGVLVMHSDGVASLRDLGPYPGLFARDPGLVAGVLYRDFSRHRDDATCVVARGLAA